MTPATIIHLLHPCSTNSPTDIVNAVATWGNVSRVGRHRRAAYGAQIASCSRRAITDVDVQSRARMARLPRLLISAHGTAQHARFLAKPFPAARSSRNMRDSRTASSSSHAIAPRPMHARCWCRAALPWLEHLRISVDLNEEPVRQSHAGRGRTVWRREREARSHGS